MPILTRPFLTIFWHFSGPFSQSTASVLDNGSDLDDVRPIIVSSLVSAARQCAGRYGRRRDRSGLPILSGLILTIFSIFGDTNRPKHRPRNRQRRRPGRRSTPHATLLDLLSSPICRTPLAIVGLASSAAGSNRPVLAVGIGFSPRRQLQVGTCCSTTRTIWKGAIASAASSILVVNSPLL